jgi:hypothetical protein
LPAALALAAALPLVALLLSCGGSSSNSASNGGGGGAAIAQQVAACEAGLPHLRTAGLAANEASIVVDAGPCAYGVPVGSPSGTAASVFIVGSQNLAYTNVTICVPGTTTCQTIDHILVDTGSSGLRIMSSVLSSSLNLTQETVGGAPLFECGQFADGYTWGSIRNATVSIGGTGNTGETTTHGIAIQIIGDSDSYTVPTPCSSTGVPELDSVAAFGANGIIGIGLFINDCITGDTCFGSASSTPLYYTCTTSTSCDAADVPATQQVSNPVGSFATDFNGVIVSLPALPALSTAYGAQNVYGNLFFGVATQANNAISTLNTGATVYLADGFADFNSQISSSSPSVPLGESTSYCANSFIDSGSNGIFLPADVANIPTDTNGWFIPVTAGNVDILAMTASIQGAFLSGATASSNPSNTSPSIGFNIANADTLLFTANGGNDTAYSALGGTQGSAGTCATGGTGTETASNSTSGIDWGVPFFYGRPIAIGNELLGNVVGTDTVTGPALQYNGAAYTGPFWVF